jgi:hypothetical protein
VIRDIADPSWLAASYCPQDYLTMAINPLHVDKSDYADVVNRISVADSPVGIDRRAYSQAVHLSLM